MRTLYVLNVDWQSEQDSRPCTLLLNDSRFEILAEKYSINTIRCAHNIAVMLEGNTSDILEIRKEADKYILICQTAGKNTRREKKIYKK